MSAMPSTSMTLIRTLAGDPESERWSELYRLYERPMRIFLDRNYPSLEADDLIQETMISLVKRLPTYVYMPDEKGHFRNYLMGILKHKAMDALRRRKRAADAAMATADAAASDEDAAWRKEALEVAISHLLADASVNAMHRAVFDHVALRHEKPDSVAKMFGISRDNVDKIKSRLLQILQRDVERLVG
ncbi:MAG: sigma-70 family RNA polymerase sigma factor [Kiritimatiellae bacterium]|nr:sigma-70 family RNA polymerase sigma factor [Kiritimatiellia bacterium]